MEDVKKNKVRDSRFEVLRIIAMLLIVSHHFSVHGFTELPFSYNKIIVDIFSLGGKLGVNLFVLISAYFMVDSKFTFKKFIKIWGETWFYSVAILILFKFWLNPVQEIGIKDIIKCVCPILFGQYWFITDYVLLMIFSPYLNYLINNLDKALFKKLLITIFILSICISGTLPDTFDDMSSGLFWFIILYLFAGYLKRYPNLSKGNYKKNLVISLASYFLMIMSVIFLNIMGHKLHNNTLLNTNYFKERNSILFFITSIELFLTFIKLPKKSNKIVNKIASATLGVYLIHDNIFMRPYLWKTVFNNQENYLSSNLFLYPIFVIVIVYVGCTIIDLIRQYTIEKLYLKVTNKIYDTFLAK